MFCIKYVILYGSVIPVIPVIPKKKHGVPPIYSANIRVYPPSVIPVIPLYYNYIIYV